MNSLVNSFLPARILPVAIAAIVLQVCQFGPYFGHMLRFGAKSCDASNVVCHRFAVFVPYVCYVGPMFVVFCHLLESFGHFS